MAPARKAQILLFHEPGDPQWSWISKHMPEVDWRFVPAPAHGSGPVSSILRLAAALRAAWLARRADLAISIGAGLGSALELARKALRVRTSHVLYYLNFDRLPEGAKRARMAHTYRSIERLVVSSTVEKKLYAEHFGVDPARIDVVLWGVNAPPSAGAQSGGAPYVCSVGGNSRDYRLLAQVAARRPDLRFVVVARPHNLEGLTFTPNVEVKSDIPMAEAMSVIERARLMALPLIDAECACGHVTIVAAAYLGTPLVVTSVPGVRDYVRHEQTGLLVEPGSPDAMAAAIDRLWTDEVLRRQLADNARAFASSHCTETNYVQHVRGLVTALAA